MKKHLYFAAMALAVMSSCSNDDVVDNPGTTPIDDEQAVAIELGLSAPQAMVTTRGMGTVGSTDAEQNLWKGQTLHVVMLDESEDPIKEAADDEGTIFDNATLTFQAPTQTTTDDDNTIKILDGAGDIKARYYPSTGKYSFYGYHIDNIEGSTFNVADKTVTGITITGTEDLMAAKTKTVEEATYADIWGDITVEDQALVADRAFSAWTARRGIQPILQFNHLLTRLQFNVIAGQASAARFSYNGASWTENLSPANLPNDEEDQNKSTAVFITGIKVKNVKTSEITIDLDAQTATSAAATADQELELKGTTDTDTNGNLDDLTATAPEGFLESGNDETHPTKTQVGESIMLLPGDAEIELEIAVSQLVVDTENATTEEAKTYTTKTETLTATIKASDIKQTGSTTDSANKTTFEAGDSYNINITVYSFQRIEVSAELTAWKEGGDINIAPGDQF
ncbi:fimbrillin family protein [uncultured Mediterranea sp.]|uniref:fimbrillin family protein n=1 Tax=uncultured Mediterranea sp. TaxID=1926662 RepID=UPI00258BF69D|nr:fimbrillin family protein [uncultured Mediterranea sp.]